MPTTTINLTGQELSKVDDTNVTLTLGGTPLTALLKATSITVGWSGTLADARIASAATWNAKESALTFGTGLTRTVNNVTIDSSVVTLTGAQALSNKTGNISQWTNDSGYLTSLAGAVTSVTGSGNIASSGGATPNITFTGVLPTANGGTGVNIATTALTLGTASSAVGSIVLQNATNANTITIQSGVTTSSHTLTLPVSNASGVLTNNGSGTLTWAAASSGITINSTVITGGGANRILFENSSNQVSESATDFYFTAGTPFNTVYAYGRTGVLTGTENTLMGYFAGKLLTTGLGNVMIGSKAGASATGTQQNVFIGIGAGSSNTTTNFNQGNVFVGYNAGTANVTADLCVFVGWKAGQASTGRGNTAVGGAAGQNLSTGTWNTFVGYNSGANQGTGDYNVSIAGVHTNGTSSSITLGYLATSTASNQCVIGAAAAASGIGVVNNLYFNGVTHTSAAPIVINSCGGSGSNNAGASLTFATRSTGNATPPDIIFQTGTTLASGSTLQTATTRFTIGELRLTAAVPIKLMGYTVAGLPTGSVGDLVYITDGLAPTYGATVVGGGAVVTLVMFDGANWIVH